MIKLIKSTFYEEKKTKKALCEFITTADQLSIGRMCEGFEQSFARWQGREYCILFNSGSSANLAMIQALLNMGRIKKNDLVGVSALTWATNVMPLIQLGLRPVPIDVSLSTLNISPDQVKEAYKKTKFKALFLTNLLGFSDDLTVIRDFCVGNDVLLLEDNCESLGSEYAGIKLGNFGVGATFSFFVGHHMSTIEGGAVCTNDKALDTMLRMVRSHGWDRNIPRGEQAALRKENEVNAFYAKYTFYDLGYNIRPTEIQGFLGLNQLQYLDEIIDKREANFRSLSLIYSDNDDFEKVSVSMNRLSNFAFPIICKNKVKQAEYIRRCDDAQIEVRPIVGGLVTTQPFYKKYVGSVPGEELPNSQHIHDYGFYFGNNPEMTKEEIQYIVDTLRQ